jgi:hypothetical protein
MPANDVDEKRLLSVNNKVHSRININFMKYTVPILYREDRISQIYMIQNVENGSFRSAMSLALAWYKYGINYGYYIKEDETIKEETYYPFVLYGISSEGILVPILDKKLNIDEEYISILSYLPYEQDTSDISYYAAILNM